MHQSNEEAQRQQDMGNAFDEAAEKIAQITGAALFQGIEHENDRRNAGSGADKMQALQGKGLGEVADACFTAVVLQVAINKKGDGGIESLIRRLRRIAIGFERQPALVHQAGQRPDVPDDIERQHGPEAWLPAHIPPRINAGQAEEEPLCGVENSVRPGAFAYKYLSHVFTQGDG